jgi:hypothetical protein
MEYTADSLRYRKVPTKRFPVVHTVVHVQRNFALFLRCAAHGREHCGESKVVVRPAAFRSNQFRNKTTQERR